MNKTVPYYAFNKDFEIVYRSGSNSFPVNPHTHNALEIYFTLTDLPDVLLNDTVSSVPKGSLIVIPPHHIHQLFNQKQPVYDRYIITISNTWLSNVLEYSKNLMSYVTVSNKPTIIHLNETQDKQLQQMLKEYIDYKRDSSLADYADFFRILDSVDKIITTGLNAKTDIRLISHSQKHVNEIIAYINSHLTEELSLEKIAAQFYLNKDYINRLFKEHTHASIGHYIAVQRASLAQGLLAKGYSVTEVQEQMGFSSYAYFFKFFKKMTGISPSQYRKSVM